VEGREENGIGSGDETMATSTSRWAIVWTRFDGDDRPLPAVYLGHSSVPAGVRREIVSRMNTGSHNGVIRHGGVDYEWQG
jgi:hypothetical protein